MDLAVRHLCAVSGASGPPPITEPALRALWTRVQHRARAGEIPATAFARASTSYLSAVHALPTQPPLAKSRVRDDRERAFVRVSLDAAARITSTLPDLDARRRRVGMALGAGLEWSGRGPAELAAVVDAVRVNTMPGVGLDVADLDIWRSLYIRYEAHSLVARAFDVLMGRSAHAAAAGARARPRPRARTELTREVDVIVRHSPGHADLCDQVATLFLDEVDGRVVEATIEPFHRPIPNAVISVRSIAERPSRITLIDDDDRSVWMLAIDSGGWLD